MRVHAFKSAFVNVCESMYVGAYCPSTLIIIVSKYT